MTRALTSVRVRGTACGMGFSQKFGAVALVGAVGLAGGGCRARGEARAKAVQKRQQVAAVQLMPWEPVDPSFTGCAGG